MESEYQKKIIEYYGDNENAYRDTWDLDQSMSIHYGYWDEKVRTFPQSLLRMNEIMMETAGIKKGDKVLDAGCGVGGSSIWLAKHTGCQVTGITLSERQVELAKENATRNGVEAATDFMVMDYAETRFPGESFDIVWGCESVCYASDKNAFIKEAFRLLRPGGRLVVADGFVTKFIHNDRPVIKKWLEGWQVNHLISPGRFKNQMQLEGFMDADYRDITKHVMHSSRRLLKYYFLASGYQLWMRIISGKRWTAYQDKNRKACWHQYWGLWGRLWQYGLIVGRKPD
jgi:tocopherol O-methyltransferase